MASAITGALTAVFTLWRIRRHHERTRREMQGHREHLTEHHETTRAHITEQLAGHAAAQNDRLDVLSNQIAALHAKFDDQQGGTP